MVSHQEEKPFKCSVCGKGVNSRQHLKRHEITHTKSFKCNRDGCTESFYKHQLLRHHILSVHDKALYCKICDKDFKRPYRLTQHNLKFHGEAPAYQCDSPGCFSNFKTWSALQLHIKTEHPKFKCPICKKKCTGRNGLRLHIATHNEESDHELDKDTYRLRCAYCDIESFNDKSALIEHYRSYHDSNVPEMLQELGSGMPLNTDNLRIYEGLLSDEEDEPEDISPASHGSMDSLSSTLRSSKGLIIDLISGNFATKKIPCPKKKCGRMFSREYDLKRHLKWHTEHLQKVEKFLESLEKENEKDEVRENEKEEVKENENGENKVKENENGEKEDEEKDVDDKDVDEKDVDDKDVDDKEVGGSNEYNVTTHVLSKRTLPQESAQKRYKYDLDALIDQELRMLQARSNNVEE